MSTMPSECLIDEDDLVTFASNYCPVQRIMCYLIELAFERLAGLIYLIYLFGRNRDRALRQCWSHQLTYSRRKWNFDGSFIDF